MLRKVTVLLMMVGMSASAASYAASQANIAVAPATSLPQPVEQISNAKPPAKPSTALPIDEVQRFTAAMSQIQKYYVDNVDNKTLFENAMKGMVSGLDPHSSYLDVEDFDDLRSHTTGEFGGLGIEIGVEAGYIKIISPLDDSPAQKAGLKPGDLIIKIDNQPVEDMDLRDAVNKMRGPAGSKVTLTIYHKGDKGPKNVVVTREIIHTQSIKSKMLDDGYGYIRISQFQQPTVNDLNAALAKLKTQNNNQDLKGLVLDLRNDPGGLLEAAIGVSDTFLDSNKLGKNNLIVYTKGRIPDSQVEAHATPGDLLNGAPIVVLVNEGSASASEIVAGALQDQKRAIIMGTQTFGKGSVQTVLPLDDKTGIKITTALYYTPNGRSIQAKGIEPDIVVPTLDVKPDKTAEKIAMVMVKESDLSAHLANGNAPATPADKNAVQPASTDATVKDEKSTQPLAVTDYQLNEALMLLKGLNVIGNKATS
jgi:carboxyl-terminal processing protease